MEKLIPVITFAGIALIVLLAIFKWFPNHGGRRPREIPQCLPRTSTNTPIPEPRQAVRPKYKLEPTGQTSKYWLKRWDGPLIGYEVVGYVGDEEEAKRTIKNLERETIYFHDEGEG